MTATQPHALNATQVENVNKWIAALRSGKYEQGQGRLCRDNRYCCLGVACESLGVEKHSNGSVVAYADSTHMLPRGASDSLGLTEVNGRFNRIDWGMTFASALWELNDQCEMPLPEIADFIESELATNAHGLFITTPTETK